MFASAPLGLHDNSLGVPGSPPWEPLVEPVDHVVPLLLGDQLVCIATRVMRSTSMHCHSFLRCANLTRSYLIIPTCGVCHQPLRPIFLSQFLLVWSYMTTNFTFYFCILLRSLFLSNLYISFTFKTHKPQIVLQITKHQQNTISDSSGIQFWCLQLQIPW